MKLLSYNSYLRNLPYPKKLHPAKNTYVMNIPVHNVSMDTRFNGGLIEKFIIYFLLSQEMYDCQKNLCIMYRQKRLYVFKINKSWVKFLDKLSTCRAESRGNNRAATQIWKKIKTKKLHIILKKSYKFSIF